MEAITEPLIPNPVRKLLRLGQYNYAAKGGREKDRERERERDEWWNNFRTERDAQFFFPPVATCFSSKAEAGLFNCHGNAMCVQSACINMPMEGNHLARVRVGL